MRVFLKLSHRDEKNCFGECLVDNAEIANNGYKIMKNIKQKYAAWLCLGMCLSGIGFVSTGHAAQAVNQYNASIVDNQVKFILDMAEPLSVAPIPYAYGIKPYKIVVDFDKTKYDKLRTFVSYPGRDDVESVTIIQDGAMTRLIVSTQKPMPYKQEVNGNQYVLTLSLPPQPKTYTAPAPVAEPAEVVPASEVGGQAAPAQAPELAPEMPSPMSEPPQMISPGSGDQSPLRAPSSMIRQNELMLEGQNFWSGPKVKVRKAVGTKFIGYTGKILPMNAPAPATEEIKVLPMSATTQSSPSNVATTPADVLAATTPVATAAVPTVNSASQEVAIQQPVLGAPIAIKETMSNKKSKKLTLASDINKPVRSTNQVVAVNFDRSESGGNKVVVDLGNTSGDVTIAREGKDLVVDFIGTRVPSDLQKRFETAGLGGIMKNVVLASTNMGSRMRISADGLWDHSAYQIDNRFVAEINPADPMTHMETQGLGGPKRTANVGGGRGDRLSLNLQNIDTRSLLQIFADFSGVNIVASDSVTGAVTLRLKDVPWRQALNVVLESKDLVQTERGNVIWVAPKSEVVAREQAVLNAKNQITNNAPLDSYAYTLKYQRATDVQNMLTGSGGAGAGGRSYVSDRGSVIADPKTNQLFITETASRIDGIKAFLARIDVPIRQVMIEARMVEAKDDYGRNLGAKLGFADARQVRGGQAGVSLGNDVRGGIFGTLNGAANSLCLSGNCSGGTIADNNFLSLPAAAINGANPATMAISIFSNIANRFLTLELSALEATGQGKIISSPKVVTSNNVSALIEQGTELPYQSSTSSGATQVQFKKANLRLEVTPQITPDNNVLMDVEVANDSVGISTPVGFAVDTKRVKTQVLVENGGTVMIGGIYQQEKRNQVEKVPVLGDVPVLGNLFKTTRKSDRKVEMLIFLTPRIIDGKVVLQ